MIEFNIKDTVKFHSTGDPILDGKIGIIEGFYGSFTEAYPIVMFAPPHPEGYYPAIVITPYCVEKV